MVAASAARDRWPRRAGLALLVSLALATVIIGLLLGFGGYDAMFKNHNHELYESLRRKLSFCVKMTATGDSDPGPDRERHPTLERRRIVALVAAAVIVELVSWYFVTAGTFSHWHFYNAFLNDLGGRLPARAPAPLRRATGRSRRSGEPPRSRQP